MSVATESASRVAESGDAVRGAVRGVVRGSGCGTRRGLPVWRPCTTAALGKDGLTGGVK